MAQVQVTVTAEEFLAQHLVILKGDRKDGKGEYSVLTIQKDKAFDASAQAIADMFGVKTIDLRKAK